MEPYTLLSKLLSIIEDGLGEMRDVDNIARSLSISSVHLQRIFKFAFGVPLSSYIRSRRLTASLELLLKSNLNILDVAQEYGFKYEQSYIRAFKREFGLTPGELRKKGQIVKVTPPIHLFENSRLAEGVLFGPEIVMVPEFCVAGRRHQIAFRDSVKMPPEVAKDFWHNDRDLIKNPMDRDVYIGFTRVPKGANFSYYLPSIQVKDLDEIPEVLVGDTFATALCARFHYIGQHHYYDINMKVARDMYNAIATFANAEDAKYETCHNELFFERIDTTVYDGTYCQMEWFTPVFEKTDRK